MKTMLRKIFTKFEMQWDKALPYILFAYREVLTETTGFSPFEMLYGRKIRGPLDILKETWEAKEMTPVSEVRYVQRVQQNAKVWYDRNARQ